MQLLLLIFLFGRKYSLRSSFVIERDSALFESLLSDTWCVLGNHLAARFPAKHEQRMYIYI